MLSAMLWVRAALVACVLLMGAGCAFFDRENRRTLNAMDAYLIPESGAARWALAPMALPAGLVGFTADVLVVHPATTLDDAWGDTVEWLWTPREHETSFRRAVMTPLAAVATPFVFTGDWLWRSVFLVQPRAEEDGP